MATLADFGPNIRLDTTRPPSDEPVIAEGPDGQEFEFPPGTTREAIVDYLRNHYNPNPYPNSRGAPQRAGDKRLEGADVTGGLRAYGQALFGLGDEASGLVEGVLGTPGQHGANSPIGALIDPTRGGADLMSKPRQGWTMGQRLQAAGNAFQRGYREGSDTALEEADTFAMDRPVSNVGIQIGGVLAGPVAGSANALSGAARGGNLLMRSGQGAGAAALMGGAFGLGDRGTMDERLQSARTNALFAAPFGAALPVAGRALSPRTSLPLAVGTNTALGGGIGYLLGDSEMGREFVASQTGNEQVLDPNDHTLALDFAKWGAGIGGGATAFRSVPRATLNALAPARVVRPAPAEPVAPPPAPERPPNAVAGPGQVSVNAPATPPRPPPPPPSSTVPPTRATVDERLLRMADRRRLTPEVADEIAAEAEATGRNPMTAEVFGEPGLQRLQTNTSLPGKTPQAAADQIRADRLQQSTRVRGDVNQAFEGVGTRMEARGAIAQRYEEIAPEYDRVLAGANVSPESEARLTRVLAGIPEKEIQPVVEEARTIAHLQGRTLEDLPVAQQMHYIKMGLGQRIGDMKREGLRAVVRRELTLKLNSLRSEMEEAIPGYRDVNARWADTAQSDEALQWADDVFAGGRAAMRPDEIAAEFKAMSPAQQNAALTSIKNRIVQTIEERAKLGERATNISDPFLRESFHERMRAILGDDAANTLLRNLRAEDRRFVNRSSVLPRTNSKTIGVFADMMDQAASHMPSKSNVLMQGADALWRWTGQKFNELARDREGAMLLKEMTPAEIRALRQELMARIQQRRKFAQGAVRNGYWEGATGAFTPPKSDGQ